MFKKKCVVCGQYFISKAFNAKYCSMKCIKTGGSHWKAHDKVTFFNRYVEAQYPRMLTDDEERACFTCGKKFIPYTCTEDSKGIHVSGRFFCSFACCKKADEKMKEEGKEC
jgi:uncharacterized protein (DUF2126 family)